MGTNQWFCEMCHRSLEESVKSRFNILDLTPDQIIDQDYQESWEGRKRSYIRDRERTHPKKTCCRSCGYNFSAWLRNQDSKSSYYRDSFECFVCRKKKVGGRVLKSGQRSVMICRVCHRKRLTSELRREWEIFNRENRLGYQRSYYSKNRKEVNRKKRLWRSRKRENGGVSMVGGESESRK